MHRLSTISFSVLIALTAACGSGGGGGGTEPPTTSNLSIGLLDEGGVLPVNAPGIVLTDEGVSVQPIVLQATGGIDSDVTSQAQMKIDDPSVAFYDGSWIHPGAVGATVLRATFDGREVATALEVLAVADVSIEELWIDPADLLVLNSQAPLPVEGTLLLASGDFVDADDRVTWASLDPTVFTVDAQGVATAVADGRTFLTASVVGEAVLEQVEVIVALPQPSNSMLDVNGGFVQDEGASVWIPPLALGASSFVRVIELSEAELPAPLPGNASLMGAVSLETDSIAEFELPATLSLQPATEGGTPGLAQIYVLDMLNSVWLHFAWVSANELGLFEWVTDFPGIFAIAERSGIAGQLMQDHAPVLVVGRDDIAPISLEFLLEHCDLSINDGFVFDTLVTATPTTADLLANNTARHYLHLDADVRAEFNDTTTWGGALLGGVLTPGTERPTVYSSVRPVQFGRTRLGGAQSLLAVQYWMLYAASGKPQGFSSLPFVGDYDLEHEGDLEFVQVLLDGHTDPPTPIAATASQHYYGEGLPYRDLGMSSGRWEAYVSLAGHATYFQRGFGGVGNEHGTFAGCEGFIGKVSSVSTVDRCPTVAQEVRLVPGTDYDIVNLDGATPAATALRTWTGKIANVPFVPRRGPGPNVFRMYDRPLTFHRAYNFSTAISINAYFEVLGPGGIFDPLVCGSIPRRVRMGRRMFDLQERVRVEFATGPVQERIDIACGGQPAYLAEYLRGPDSYRAPAYFACDNWRVTRITPGEPRMGVVGEPFSLTVDWSGVNTASQSVVVQPLRVIVLPSFEGGHLSIQTGTYDGPKGPISFSVSPELVIEEAAVNETSLTVHINWIYSEGGVAMDVPTEACESLDSGMDWRFNLFIRDGSDLTLYHTNSLAVGPFVYERNGPPIDITTSLCQ